MRPSSSSEKETERRGVGLGDSGTTRWESEGRSGWGVLGAMWLGVHGLFHVGDWRSEGGLMIMMEGSGDRGGVDTGRESIGSGTDIPGALVGTRLKRKENDY